MRSFKKYYFHFEYRDSNNNNTIFSLTLHSSVCQGLVITQEPFLVSLVVNPSVLVSIHLSVTVSCWPFLCLRHRRWAFPTWGQGHSLSIISSTLILHMYTFLHHTPMRFQFHHALCRHWARPRRWASLGAFHRHWGELFSSLGKGILSL